jgi:hypothetical protein
MDGAEFKGTICIGWQVGHFVQPCPSPERTLPTPLHVGQFGSTGFAGVGFTSVVPESKAE